MSDSNGFIGYLIKGGKMKSRLAPDHEKLWKQTLRDTLKFLAGKPSGYRKIGLPASATKKGAGAAPKENQAKRGA
jgi:hypothetical protein